MSVAPKLEEKSGYYDGYCDNEGLLKEKAVYKPLYIHGVMTLG